MKEIWQDFVPKSVLEFALSLGYKNVSEFPDNVREYMLCCNIQITSYWWKHETVIDRKGDL